MSTMGRHDRRRRRAELADSRILLVGPFLGWDDIARGLIDFCRIRASRVALFAVDRDGALRGLAGAGVGFETKRLSTVTVPAVEGSIFDAVLRNKEFHFGEHDVTITCEDTQYQKLAFSPCKDSILAKVRSKGGSLWESIVQQVAQVSATIQGEIGRELTLDQIREKMSGAPAGGASAPAAAVATEDIDNLVDNLLD